MSRNARLDEAILALDEKLGRLQLREQEARNLLEFICEQKRSLEAERAALEAQRNPFDWLPTELLIHIFTSYVHPDDVLGCGNIDRSYWRPVVLSHVCRRWRAVALSVSTLWTSVSFSNMHAAQVFLERSKDALIDLVRTVPYSTLSAGCLRGHLADSLQRWRSVTWKVSKHESLLILLMALNDNSSLPNLRELNLAQQEAVNIFRGYTGRSILNPSPLQALRSLRLAQVAPSDIPPSVMPNLQTLELNFPVSDPMLTNHLLRMSNLCALVSRAPNLTEIVLNDAVPLMDVYIHPEVDGDTPRHSDNPHLARRTPQQIHSIVLPNVRRLEWSFAPPRDSSMLFFFIEVPALRQLELCLNTWDVRWTQYYNHAHSMGTVNPFLGQPAEPVAQFNRLEELSVECVDADGLSTALKKMKFPALKKLSLTYIPPVTGEKSIPQLPRHESIFREPRLPTLTHLTLSHFDLDLENTKTMLRYMQSLTHLTFNSCLRAGKVVCALSGGTCANSHINPVRVWICPRLEHLRLVNCTDLRFGCLSEVVRTRHAASSNNQESDGAPKFLLGGLVYDPACERVMKPLKKRAPLVRNVVLNVSRQTNLTSPTSTSASLNGSYVPGWKPHEVSKPSSIRSLHIAACPRVSQVEAMSLKEEKWGVSAVAWYI